VCGWFVGTGGASLGTRGAGQGTRRATTKPAREGVRVRGPAQRERRTLEQGAGAALYLVPLSDLREPPNGRLLY